MHAAYLSPLVPAYCICSYPAKLRFLSFFLYTQLISVLMASDSIMSFEASSSSVEFEDIDMAELDADTLMKLLEEEPAAGGEEQEGGGGCAIQPPAGGWIEESNGSRQKKEEEEVFGDEVEWLLDVTEMSPAPPCAVEVGGGMLDMGEYGLDYYYNNNNGAFLGEEMGFEEGLWQNSY
ncbi:uncharacterized protein LOC116011282 [Ipomoea triloba]|uniref:uncharacterized protein LOC116011282 n=1 Tax=Ipomoea triloba TaxID=35885 RepID=UPI00125E8930|nr:uncharacterized protein LOC116011282 [Ipomoea triloba]